MRKLFIFVYLLFLTESLAFAKSEECFTEQSFDEKGIKESKVLVIGNVHERNNKFYLKVDKSWKDKEDEIELVVFKDNSYMRDSYPNIQVVDGQRVLLQSRETSFFSKFKLTGCESPLVVIFNKNTNNRFGFNYKYGGDNSEKEFTDKIEKIIGKPIQTNSIQGWKWFWQD